MFHTPSNLLALTIILLTTTNAYTLPSPILPSGATNPFYPCPATDISTCPYRCYTLPSANLTATPPTLDPTCYSASTAAARIADSTHICLRCLSPLPNELPCIPLATYFEATTPDSPPPPRCGFRPKHLLRNCTWDCGKAQVPFSVCSARNETGPYSLCERCVPGCSTPRIVFEPPKLPKAFNLSNGTCGTGAEAVVCPWRCTDAGNPYTYCSLVERVGSFTQCVACE